MKSKPLANVLLKIIGLYVCLCAIPGLVVGISAVILTALGEHKLDHMLAWPFPEALGAVIQIVVGALLTIKSRNLAEFWFKNEDD
jgi:hypothetical protein